MQSYRQSELFAGNDWRAIYRAFTTINFNASDPPSINAAMREYIRNAYPEDFNDWIESSEFVAIIELLSWLAGSLAYKTDITSRENFLESAETRESILRLARFLSYNPHRAMPARGLVKLVQVSTDDDLTDAYGQSLTSRTVAWDDPVDPDWYEKFITIINNALVKTNPFGGVALKDGYVGGVRTQLYRTNSRMANQTLNFSAEVSGETMDFETVNGDFDASLGFYERTPNQDGAFHLYYRNDGNGNSSANTGFFLLIKQGTTRRESFRLNSAVENLLLDLAASNISESDVWVQSVDDSGSVLTTWERVPAIFSENITYNSISADTRTIYSAITRDADRVSLRFSDGRFGAVPVGNLVVTYRVVNGQQYQIRPQEIDMISVPLRFVNRRGVTRTLTLTFRLMETIGNATARETEEQIRLRAPGAYAAQGRMVSGEDYNRFPLQGNAAIKLKALNRVYSGHSRHIDLHDPTATYQDTSVFADDGVFFAEPKNSYLEIPSTANVTMADLVVRYLQPMLSSRETTQYVQSLLFEMQAAITATVDGIVWTTVTTALTNSSGRLARGTGLLESAAAKYIVPGATLLLETSAGTKWVEVVSVTGNPGLAPADGTAGPVMLAEAIDSGAVVRAVIPAYAAILTSADRTAVETRLGQNLSFALWYDHAASSPWSIRDPDAGTMADGSAVKVMTADFVNGGIWRLRSFGLRYVFESVRKVQWHNDGSRALDVNGQPMTDTIRVLGVNQDVNDFDGRGLRRDYDLFVDGPYYQPDGNIDPRRCLVRFADHDDDGYPDVPDLFARIVSRKPEDRLLFWQRQLGSYDPVGTFKPIDTMLVFETEDALLAANLPNGTAAFVLAGNAQARNNAFWVRTNGAWKQNTQDYRFAHGRGFNVAKTWYGGGDTPVSPGNLMFHWKHYAASDRRIDPARTNIIDVFALTSEYDFQVRQWIRNGSTGDFPEPPTDLDLRATFAEFENYKMFSDQIVWRPVRYKFLFGPGSVDELRAKFKIVKMENSVYSDGEIKSRVVRAINDYFDVNFWDFGATFYFTELAAFLHQQLANTIASVVVVPMSEGASFGDGFEVRCRADEMFISTASVDDVVIINANTAGNLRMR